MLVIDLTYVRVFLCAMFSTAFYVGNSAVFAIFSHGTFGGNPLHATVELLYSKP